jgi:hypothetical protein
MAVDIFNIVIFGILALNGLVLVLALAHAINYSPSND